MTTARGLLKAIDGLSFPDRQRLLARHGRRLAGTAELTALLDELHGRDELIADLRRHPDPDVRLAALDTFTTRE